jgi:omega-6 fatty acid desaturase (delta-12 desaturase)
MSVWRQKVLRIIRNPFVFFLFVPAVLFFILHHFTLKKGLSIPKKYFSVATTLSSVGLLVFFSYVFGTTITLLTWLPGAYLASVIAVWLFFIQHSFEDAYWQPSNTFSAENSALHGSSFLNFPKFLHWCTGNIGYHHIHHANSKIPNYNLTPCHQQISAFQECKTITFWEMFKSYNLVLWDEHQQKLIPLPARA